MNIPRFGMPAQPPGLFENTMISEVSGSHDRPMKSHVGVRVMRHDQNDLTQVDEYPDATGWTVNDDGSLDVHDKNSKYVDVATYPEQCWRRVWFPGAENKTPVVKLSADKEIPAPAEPDDVAPLVYDGYDPDEC